MIRWRKYTIPFDPELPIIYREHVGSDYPADKPLPKLRWAVTFECGELGSGQGSYGLGYTLKEALESAAENGWSPIKRFSVKIGWDRVFEKGCPSPLMIVPVTKWQNVQKMIDLTLSNYQNIIVPDNRVILAKMLRQ